MQLQCNLNAPHSLATCHMQHQQTSLYVGVGPPSRHMRHVEQQQQQQQAASAAQYTRVCLFTVCTAPRWRRWSATSVRERSRGSGSGRGSESAHVPSWSYCWSWLCLLSLYLFPSLSFGAHLLAFSFTHFYTICFRSSFCWHFQKCIISVAFAVSLVVVVAVFVCLIGGRDCFLLRCCESACVCVWVSEHACVLVCESAHCTRIAVFAANILTSAAVAALPTLRWVAALNCVVNANYLLFYSRSNVVVVVAAFPKSRNEKIEKHILEDTHRRWKTCNCWRFPAMPAARRQSDRALHARGLYHTSITVDNVKW